MNLHIKIKHNGGSKTERERAAVNFSILPFFFIEVTYRTIRPLRKFRSFN